ncbi:MAG: FAD-dependent oxidoreductase, partial [Propionivibrio sp.]
QRNNCRRAVVAGAGLLGLEAAHALQKLGLKVTVLANTDYILNRQLDAHGAALLQRYLASQEIEILTGAEATALVAGGNGRVSAVRLNDGSELPAEVFLACTGVKPNVELAKASGIATRWGIVVDDRMQTNLAGVFAAGDVTEHEGISFGLWAVAVEQGQVAAINALGGQRQYQGDVPKTMLKVTGIDLLSVGSVSAYRENEIEIAEEQSGEFRYRKLVLASGRAVGAILIGHPDLAETVADLVKQGTNLTALLPALRRGDWDVLMQAEMAA